MKYALVDPATVDHETQRAAYTALAWASKELQLPMVNIKWFEHYEFVKNPTETFENDQDIRGQYWGKTPDTIYIRAGQFAEKIQETVLHETFHLWQSLDGHGGNQWNEDRANGYAADAMWRMKNDPEMENIYLDHLTGNSWASERNQKEMDRRLGKPKATPASKPKAPQPPRSYDKRTGGTRVDGAGYYSKKVYGRICD